VLGFDAGERGADGSIELTSGRARIHLGGVDTAPDLSSDGPPGSAIVFFDVNDVEAMHAAIRTRGGQPSALEKVNWIKRRVFEVRDPDGHVAWFGQSYHEKSPDRPRHAELVRSGADVQGEPVSQPWGLREFSVLDPDRNRLTFSQTFE
jgi:uncharacterized glyoxalase superfamily protein PhnB